MAATPASAQARTAVHNYDGKRARGGLSLLASMMIMEAVLENWAWNRRTTIVCVCAHLFALLHDLSNVSFYNLSHAFTRQPPKTKHVLPIENKSKGIC